MKIKAGLLALMLLPTLSFAEVVDEVVYVVNNEIILKSDFSRLEKKAQNPALIDEILLDGKSIADLKKDKKVQTDYLINERILDAEVKKQSLTATADRVDREITQMAQNYKTTREDILAAARRDMNLTTDEYKKHLRTQIERQSLIAQEVTSKIRVSDEEIYEEYKKRNPNYRANVAEVKLAQIYFNPKKGGDQAAKARGEAALERLNNNAKFDTVAEQTSEDSDFVNGGLLGTFKSGELNPEFEAAISGLKEGQVSKVFKSKRGYHILKVLELKAISDPQFDKDKERIRNIVTERSFERQFHAWLKKKREEATITSSETL